MSKVTSFSLAAVVVSAFAIASPLGATSVDVTAGMLNTTQTGVTTVNFNNGAVPSNFTFTGNANVVRGSETAIYLQPANDNSPYAYVSMGGSITANLGASGANYFGLYWGSPDVYNSITFTDTQGNTVTYGGGGLPIPTFSAYQNNTDSYVQFFDSGYNWVSVTFASSLMPAFEFDNVSYGIINDPLVAPEPASIALFIVGLLAVGVGVLRRRNAA